MCEITREQIIEQIAAVMRCLTRAMGQIAVLTSVSLDPSEAQNILLSVHAIAIDALQDGVEKIGVLDNVNIELN